MAARDDEGDEGERGLLLGEKCRGDVPFQVVDTDKGDVPRQGEGLGHGESDEQGAHQSGTTRDRDPVYHIERDARLLQGFPDDGDDDLHVLP